jgi:UPF0176 protein
MVPDSALVRSSGKAKMNSDQKEILAFYEFKDLPASALPGLKESLKAEMMAHGVRGTILLAPEGFNAMVCGTSEDLANFVQSAQDLLDTRFVTKSSFAPQAPFRKIDVRIKKEIVTLKKQVNITLGENTHVDPRKWNELISDPQTLVLDTRNDYEYQTGTFRRAVNPGIAKFSELPDFVEENLDPQKHKRVAMFCTGGIRCEKFAPYMKERGFDEVYQLEGGILKYLELTPASESLWSGECFVFDERITVDANLQKGTQPDRSQRHSTAQMSEEKG